MRACVCTCVDLAVVTHVPVWMRTLPPAAQFRSVSTDGRDTHTRKRTHSIPNRNTTASTPPWACVRQCVHEVMCVCACVCAFVPREGVGGKARVHKSDVGLKVGVVEVLEVVEELVGGEHALVLQAHAHVMLCFASVPCSASMSLCCENTWT